VQATLATDCSLEAESNLTERIIEGVTAFESDISVFLAEMDAK